MLLWRLVAGGETWRLLPGALSLAPLLGVGSLAGSALTGAGAVAFVVSSNAGRF